MLRHAYTLTYCLALPLIIARQVWRSRTIPEYRRRLPERIACFKTPDFQNGLWVHAVSFGEVVAATPLIQEFQRVYPDVPVMVTTTTSTGSTQVQKTFGSKISHVYLPYDIPVLMRRFLNKVKPRVCMIMETELWPNLLSCCQERGISVLLANARLSERSMQKYLMISSLTKSMLERTTIIATQTDLEKTRYENLGAAPRQIHVTGSIKFDTDIPNDLISKADALRASWGAKRSVFIAASTHEGEEKEVLAAFKKIRDHHSNALLILVPRHPDRFDNVFSFCCKQGFTVARRSLNNSVDRNTDIFLGDTMGELLLFYGVADVAFVGGSLAPVGGHNLLEPAALAKPILTGPVVHNFTAISEMLSQADAMKVIQDADELAQVVNDWFSNPELCRAIGIRGQQVVEKNRGALKKQFRLLQGLYERDANT